MNNDVANKFDTYPKDVQSKLKEMRALIFTIAKQDKVPKIEETLKWGEPSYISTIGSTVRIDWKIKHPKQLRVYFNCQTKLVETFKELYGDTFIYEGNRAMVFNIDEEIPLKELSHCISLSLRYKKIKHLPLLGV